MTLIRTPCGRGLEIFHEDDPFEVDGIEYNFYEDIDDSFHPRLMFEMSSNPCIETCYCNKNSFYEPGVVWSKVMSHKVKGNPALKRVSVQLCP